MMKACTSSLALAAGRGSQERCPTVEFVGRLIHITSSRSPRPCNESPSSVQLLHDDYTSVAFSASRAVSPPSIKHSLRSQISRQSVTEILQKSERGVRGSCHRSAHPCHLIPVIPIASSRRNAEFVEGSCTMTMNMMNKISRSCSWKRIQMARSIRRNAEFVGRLVPITAGRGVHEDSWRSSLSESMNGTDLPQVAPHSPTPAFFSFD